MSSRTGLWAVRRRHKSGVKEGGLVQSLIHLLSKLVRYSEFCEACDDTVNLLVLDGQMTHPFFKVTSERRYRAE